jgi:hypothetical protein
MTRIKMLWVLGVAFLGPVTRDYVNILVFMFDFNYFFLMKEIGGHS